jgi:predicted dehydrogenase
MNCLEGLGFIVWGYTPNYLFMIKGCGRISGDFVRAMRNCKTPNKVSQIKESIFINEYLQIWAISSAHSLEKAKEFAEKNGLIGEGNSVNIYGTYEEMFNDPKIGFL